MRFLALVVLVLASTGCATVMGGPREKINISSSPAGATILLNGEDIGTTPKVINISRFRAPDLALQLEGCEPYAVQIQRNFRTGPFLLNIITPPLFFFGMGVDAATGAMFDLSPDVVNPLLSCPARTGAFGISIDPLWLAAVTSEPTPK
jgi:hypothetical protein